LTGKFQISQSKLFFLDESLNFISTDLVRTKYQRIPDEGSIVISDQLGSVKEKDGRLSLYDIRSNSALKKFENWKVVGQR
jgi:hypothetical protein